MSEHVEAEGLTENLKSYIKTSLELIKLEVTERSSVILASLIGNLLVGVIGIFFVLFFSIGAGFFLSALLNNYYLGFAIIAGFYLLLALILILGKKKLVERPLRDKIIRMLLSKNDGKD